MVMDATLREKIKRVKIHTRRVMQSTLVGDYVSAFKGSGLDFDQIREYQPGDDIRFIDWNSSAKNNKMMVKEFVEERDRTVILVIDTSRSLHYSSKSELKQEMVAQTAASLAFIAEHNKDKVGALFFSDSVEKWVPPKRGKAHINTIVQNIFSLQPQKRATSIKRALEFLIGLKKRNAILFFISDWIEEPSSYQSLLTVARHCYDFVGIRVKDEREQTFPDVGSLPVYDPETGQEALLSTGKALGRELARRQFEQTRLFQRNKIDLLNLTVGQSFINPMVRFFHQRIARQI